MLGERPPSVPPCLPKRQTCMRDVQISLRYFGLNSFNVHLLAISLQYGGIKGGVSPINCSPKTNFKSKQPTSSTPTS